MIVTLIGAGRMARALGTCALAGRHSVRIVHHASAKAGALAEQLHSTVLAWRPSVCTVSSDTAMLVPARTLSILSS